METAKKAAKEIEIEYVIESGALFIPVAGEKTMTKYLPGAVVKMRPSVAATMLLNKARPATVVEAERAAQAASSKAAAEAVTATERE